MAENIKITSDLFNSVIVSMDNHHKSYTFRHNGNEPEYQQDMENILKDIDLALEHGDDYVMVDESIMKGLVEQGLFKEVV